ncbi:MAG: UbiA family prenyltransferase [Candidatus Limnocylindrus sp.]|jgi:4-hydroxybenzoate polyprenyltransferase
MQNVIKAVEISRPLLWLNTSMPLLWGLLATQGAVQLRDLVLFVFFLFPYNYFLHAPNDYFDFETDARNPRKGGVEGALTPKPLLARHAFISTLLLVPFLAFTAVQFPPLTIASLGLLLLLSAAYNAPPTRLKGRPILDSLTNVLYAIPLQVGIHAAGGTELIAPQVLVFAAWGIGAHALTTITDRDEDAAAGVRTIAVLLGRQNTAIFSAVWFALVGVGAASLAGTPLAAALALPYLSLSMIGRDATGEAGRRLYRLFLITNVVIGASITILVMLQVPFESAVAAGATAIVGTLIALGASVGRSVLRARQRA